MFSRRIEKFSWGVAAICGLLLSSPSIAQESVLKVVPHSDIVTFDPVVTSSRIGSNYGYMVYDTLFALDEAMVPQPQMVDSYTLSDDKLTYTFTLRDGLKWHDGKPVTAEDCIASIKRWGGKDGLGQMLMKQVKELRATDDKTLVLELSQPFGMTIDALARTSNVGAFMMPKQFAEIDAATPVAEPIGSGPYKLEKGEWVQGSKIVFSKNQDYVPRSEPSSGLAGAKNANFDRVEWLIIKDPSTVMSALQLGEIDIWENTSTDMLPILEQSPDLATSVVSPLGRQIVLRFNHLHPPFDTVEGRRAVMYVTNQEEYMMAAVGDPKYFKTCVAMFFCGTPMETNVGAEPLLSNDAAKAKELFAQTGWDASKPITILQATDYPELNAAALVAAQKLRDIGLNPKLVAMDWAGVQAARNKKETPEEGGWNIFFTAAPPGNSGNPVTAPLARANCGDAFSGWPCNEKLEKLRADYVSAADEASKKAIVEAFQQEAYDFGLNIPLGQVTQPIAHRANLSGFPLTTDVNVYWNIERKAE